MSNTFRNLKGYNNRLLLEHIENIDYLKYQMLLEDGIFDERNKKILKKKRLKKEADEKRIAESQADLKEVKNTNKEHNEKQDKINAENKERHKKIKQNRKIIEKVGDILDKHDAKKKEKEKKKKSKGSLGKLALGGTALYGANHAANELYDHYTKDADDDHWYDFSDND